MLSDRDIQRICELLARFSQYTQQFEREEETTHDIHAPATTAAIQSTHRPSATNKHMHLRQGSSRADRQPSQSRYTT